MPNQASQSGSQYIFDNAAHPTADRFAGLASVFDPGSVRQLTALGVGPGWHCLEVGGGGGSLARWLSEQVGASGRVIVTDIDARTSVICPSPMCPCSSTTSPLTPCPPRPLTSFTRALCSSIYPNGKRPSRGWSRP